MTQSALLVCHNILFSDYSGDPFFGKVIARNLEQLAPFRRLVAQEFGNFKELSSTEGIGVGRRDSHCRNGTASGWGLAPDGFQA
jgi:hypothetical protein